MRAVAIQFSSLPSFKSYILVLQVFLVRDDSHSYGSIRNILDCMSNIMLDIVSDISKCSWNSIGLCLFLALVHVVYKGVAAVIV